MADVWFSDCEVYIEDFIWVFKNKRSGEIRWFHNDSFAVSEFINENPDIWLCGFNFRDYDQYILKGTLLGYDNEQLKELNDLLIFGELQDVWDYLGEEGWAVEVPPIIDLFHDIVPRKSLKVIEGYMGMNVVETGASFDIDRALTKEELKESIEYCIHDVEATEQLYYRRLPYLKNKKTLCEIAGLDDAVMMKNTNARVVSEALGAEACDPVSTFGCENYVDVMPDFIQFDKLPKKVQDYVKKVNTYSGWHDDIGSIQFYCHGTPTVMGLGGIHASTGLIVQHTLKSGPRKGYTEELIKCVPKRFVSDEDRMVVIQDIGSFYPSMMILFDYLSRAVPDEGRQLFKDFYTLRMSAKRNGAECKSNGDAKGARYWSDQANAAKLVLNTVYGCMKNQYNKLYDPFMATCVCVSGQLLILDLMNRIFDEVDDVELIQLNTDGWVLSLPRSQWETLDRVISEWKALTGFTVDTDEIKQMWQRDVNNYVIEFNTGKIKAKGGAVKNWNGGDFNSNSCTIIDKALVEFMINGVPIQDTIENCNDLERFQIIVNSSSKFDGVEKVNCITTEKTKIHGRVHRIYAVPSHNEMACTFFKYKGTSVSLFSDAPLCACEDFEIKSIDDIDKEWYNALALKKYEQFVVGKNR